MCSSSKFPGFALEHKTVSACVGGVELGISDDIWRSATDLLCSTFTCGVSDDKDLVPVK